MLNSVKYAAVLYTRSSVQYIAARTIELEENSLIIMLTEAYVLGFTDDSGMYN